MRAKRRRRVQAEREGLLRQPCESASRASVGTRRLQLASVLAFGPTGGAGRGGGGSTRAASREPPKPQASTSCVLQAKQPPEDLPAPHVRAVPRNRSRGWQIRSPRNARCRLHLRSSTLAPGGQFRHSRRQLRHGCYRHRMLRGVRICHGPGGGCGVCYTKGAGSTLSCGEGGGSTRVATQDFLV